MAVMARKVRIPSPDDLTTFREKYNLTQSRLGELLGVSRRAVAMWEAGTRKPAKSAAILFWLLKKNPENLGTE